MDTETLLNLRKFLAPEIVSGEGAIKLSGRHAINFGASKVLIVTDPGVQKAGWTSVVEESLQASDIRYAIFNGVTPNPKDYEVMAGVDLYRNKGCDLIIAVGGGSPMDCAKGIGVCIGNPGNILGFEGVDMIPNPGPPLIFIPTTSGSSADISQFAIITDSTRNVKIAIISKMVIPDIALIDPKTTITMPPELTAATGMDALCHAFEAFVSSASSPLTDMAALSSVQLITDNLVNAYRNPSDMASREGMMTASLMAGLAFSNASLGLVHAMAHSLGGEFDLPHGECNAILLEEVVQFNYPACPDKYRQLAKAMHLDIDHYQLAEIQPLIVDTIRSLRKNLGITQRLNERGVSLSDISKLAEFAYKDPCIATNPRSAGREEIEKLYQAVYK